MATGYTCKVKDGISFKEFVMICARAFGATITMRDDPLDKKIPEEFKPSPHYYDEVCRIEKELERISKISLEEAKRYAEEEAKKENERNERYKEENVSLIKAYTKLLKMVREWQPPTEDHYELKTFMIDQLKNSMEWDCHCFSKGDVILKPTLVKVIPKSPEQWLKDKENRLIEDLNYYKEEYKKEVDRVNKRNIWIKQLRDSLKEM